MAMNYMALDRAIVQAIARGKRTAADIQCAVEPHVKALLPSEHHLTVVVTLWRTIDRRLQALRKRGAIAFDRANGGWEVAAKDEGSK